MEWEEKGTRDIAGATAKESEIESVEKRTLKVRECEMVLIL